MALFGKKTGEAASGPGGSAAGEAAKPTEYSPEKAAKFFEHARTAHDTTHYGYAMTLWLQGLRWQPTNMESLRSFFDSAALFLGSKEGAKGPTKDHRRMFSGGRTDIEKFQAALLETAADPADASAAVRAVQAAGALGLVEPVRFLGERAIAIAGRAAKPRKEHFVALFETLGRFGAYDKAVQAGEIAVRLSPEDGRLAADVRNMSAQQTMSKGGYDEAGKAGGFRANVRDVEKQQRLEEQERIVKTAEVLDRVVEAARAEYEQRPADKPTIRKYARALLERGTAEDQETAHALLMRAYEATQEFDFRRLAGEIRIRQARQRVARLQSAAEQAGNNGQSAEALEAAKRELLALEIEEYGARVKAYPTDLSLKFELGRRLYDAGRYEEAISLLQEAKGEVRNRLRAMLYLGNAFERIEFHDGAIETFREALEMAGSGGVAADPETVMELKYGLMLALEGRARESGDLASAEEAYRHASAIAIQQFNYRDVRARQVALKQLVASLKSG